MMITALARKKKKKTAVAPLARRSEKLFFFDGTFGKRKRRRRRRRRRGRKEKELAAHPKAAFPSSLPPSLPSPRLLLSLCWSQQKQHCSTEKAKTYTCCMEPRRRRRIEARGSRLSALPPPFRFVGELWIERMKRKGRMTREAEGGEKAAWVNTNESVQQTFGSAGVNSEDIFAHVTLWMAKMFQWSRSVFLGDILRPPRSRTVPFQ